jgi:hypothetical protein
VTEGVPRGHWTVFLEASTDSPGRTMSQIDFGEQISPCEPKSQHRQPMECEDQVVAAPRCAGVAKVVLCSHKTLLHAVKRDGSVDKVLGADSPELEAV